MHAFKLEEKLNNYNPSIKSEKTSKKFMINFLKNNSDSFLRTNTEGHFTASSLLINKERTCALLMKHKKLNKWLQPGGHSDGNKNLLAVSIKEASEESGIKDIKAISSEIFDLDIHEIPERKGEKSHLHLDVRFLLTVEISNEIKKNHESTELKWFNKNEKLPTKEESVIRLFRKWKEV